MLMLGLGLHFENHCPERTTEEIKGAQVNCPLPCRPAKHPPSPPAPGENENVGGRRRGPQSGAAWGVGRPAG